MITHHLMIRGDQNIFAEITAAFKRIMSKRIHHRAAVADFINGLARGKSSIQVGWYESRPILLASAISFCFLRLKHKLIFHFSQVLVLE